MLIGDTLQTIRRNKKVTLTQLSNKSGVQLATLSRIENKRMVGTLESHLAIAKALGIEISDLYNPVVRGNKRIEVSTRAALNTANTTQLAANNILNKRMSPLLVLLEPGGEFIDNRKSCEEVFIYVLHGEIETLVRNKILTLNKITSFHSTTAHQLSLKNNSKNKTEFLIIQTTSDG